MTKQTKITKVKIKTKNELRSFLKNVFDYVDKKELLNKFKSDDFYYKGRQFNIYIEDKSSSSRGKYDLSISETNHENPCIKPNLYSENSKHIKGALRSEIYLFIKDYIKMEGNGKDSFAWNDTICKLQKMGK